MKVRSLVYSGLLIFLSLFSVYLLGPGRERARATYLSPPEIRHFTFGMKEQVADFFWLRALQDFDYCSRETAKMRCQSNDWLFRMLDLITDLSPHFRMPYIMGGLALTVLANDFPGASKIFDKGVRFFPDDWSLLSKAAYHALYEEDNKEKAAQLMKKAAEKGAPPWYYLLANRLATQGGDIAFTEALIQELKNGPKPDPLLIRNLENRLQKAKAGKPLGHSYEE